MDFLLRSHLCVAVDPAGDHIVSKVLFDTLFPRAENSMIQMGLPSRQEYFYGRMIVIYFVMVIGVTIVLAKAKSAKESRPVPAKAPLSATSKDRLVATI